MMPVHHDLQFQLASERFCHGHARSPCVIHVTNAKSILRPQAERAFIHVVRG